MTKSEPFERVESIKDVIKRLDFLGIYLTAPQQRSLQNALHVIVEKEYRLGFNDGAEFVRNNELTPFIEDYELEGDI